MSAATTTDGVVDLAYKPVSKYPTLAAWRDGAEDSRGKRLLPHVIDYYAYEDPNRVFAIIPRCENTKDGFLDVTMKMMASAVDNMAWWLQDKLGQSQGHQKKSTVVYVGGRDLSYVIIFFALIKVGWKVLFISPRNTIAQNMGMIERANVRFLLHDRTMERSFVENVKLQGSDFASFEIPTLSALLHNKGPAYPFEANFVDLENETCLILHSSGSTGPPKLVYLTHGTFSVTDNDPLMPVPAGRRAQNGALFDFDPPGQFYSCFPPYHMAGVQAYMIFPTFFKTTVVLGPASLTPSGSLLADILASHSRLRALYVPPSIIEQWATLPGALDRARSLSYVFFGGGPLAQNVGDALSQVTSVHPMYGSLELGQIQMLVPQVKEWEYLEPNPYEECDMQEVDDGMCEMVLHQNPKFRTWRSLSHNFPAARNWRTGDLFEPHPSKPGLWRFHSRVNDGVVLSSGHKLWPGDMEKILQADENVSGALILGNRRPEPLLLAEINPAIACLPKGTVVDAIWSSIQKANDIAPEYGKISRDRIVITGPTRQFLRTPKGTIVRRVTEALYADAIGKLYDDKLSEDGSASCELENAMLGVFRDFIRGALEELIPGLSLRDSDDLLTCQLDSLKLTYLSRKMKSGASRLQPSITSNMWLRCIYENPSVEKLTKAALGMMLQQSPADNTHSNQGIQHMAQLVDDLTRSFPDHRFDQGFTTSAVNGIKVIVIGARGRLGPHIIDNLMKNPRVSYIWCLNRGPNGPERLQEAVTEQGLSVNVHDRRLRFCSIDLTRSNFGLSDDEIRELLHHAHFIFYNLWKVDFAIPLASFRPELLMSLRTTIDLAITAPSQLRLVFVSSIASVQAWGSVSPATPVPENLVDSYEAASFTGYAQSKHVAERVLGTAVVRSKLPVTILRVGQIAGSTSGAARWPRHEWVPSIALLSLSTGLIPQDLGDIDWIPIDLASQAICELMLQGEPCSVERPLLEVYNLVNPMPSPLTEFTAPLESRFGAAAQLVPLAEWVHKLSCKNLVHLSKDPEEIPARILPFLQDLVQHGAVHHKGLQYNTGKACAVSTTMRNLKALDRRSIEPWIEQWVGC